MTPRRIEKAYENLGFLRSASARPIRVLCEMLETEERFRKQDINNTIVFFGSTNIQSKEQTASHWEKVRAKTTPNPAELNAAKRQLEMSAYYEDARELSYRLTKWALEIKNPLERFWVCSGGGPGIMEAANRGAKEADGYSIGMNISLPELQEGNPYQDPEVSFLFHYFFIRKFWFAYLAKAVIIFPGGFGTLDELFEMLTLVQTRKLKKPMPIVIYGSEYWNKIINFNALVEYQTIRPKEMHLFRIMDNVDDVFNYLQSQLTENYLQPVGTSKDNHI